MGPEVIEQCRYAMLNEKVDDGEIQRENKNRNDDDGGRGPDFLERRRGHFAHFRAYVVVERSNPFRPGPDRSYQRVLFRHCRHLDFSLPILSLNSGRGGGIRTPKSGFGDRQFNR